jgi:hypothetical protein
MAPQGSLVDGTARSSSAAVARRIRLALTALACVGLGVGSVFAIQRIAVPPGHAGLLSLGTTDAVPDRGSAALRAIALVIGETRSSDGMSFDAWYRARLNRLAPGIMFEYQAQLDGNRTCGGWRIVATVIPGAASGPTNATAVLNADGVVASVDEQTGRAVGLDLHTASIHYLSASDCNFQPPSDGHTWLDAFRADAAP